jgi:hypothetical protein
MAGFIWGNEDLDSLITNLQGRKKLAIKTAETILDDVVSEGAWQMREYIETRGTGYRGHRGRVETGYMLGDVADSKEEHQVVGNRVTGRFGWGLNGAPVPDYYRYQEQGFKNSWTGRDVPPMHALLDSFIKARISLMNRLHKAVKR